MAELDTSLACWPYDLAQLFLAAAHCCGFDCDRSYVGDGTLIEAMPPGCPCSLAALVDAAWEPPPQAPGCRPRKLAVVTLYLDMCVVLLGSDEVPDPTVMSDSARETITARQQILQGLQRARAADNLGGDGPTITPAGWVGVTHAGGIARWSTSWRWLSE